MSAVLRFVLAQKRGGYHAAKKVASNVDESYGCIKYHIVEMS